MTFVIFAAGAWAQPNVDGVVERARQQFAVPGIAVAIVKDGRIVLEKGYGVRKSGERVPVTPQSLFRIASNSKAFTASALAILVDEGKIRWDSRVVDLLPGFQMYDPYVTREMTVVDLLVHRSGLGLGAGDLMFFPPSDLTREQIVERVRYLKPATSFRSGYAYDNVLYIVAGQVIAEASGKNWEDFVQDRILTPLRMTSTFTRARVLETASDVALPHAKADGKLQVLPHEMTENHAPAGGIITCASDLARWVMLLLNHGQIANVRIFSPDQSKQLWTPRTILPLEHLPQGTPASVMAMQPNFRLYGLGFFIRDYRGHKMIYHTGTLAGYVSRIAMIPDLNLGTIVLTNAEEEGAHASITYSILDQYLGAPPTDWVAAFHEVARLEAAESEAAVRKLSAARNANSNPSLPLARYAGRYRDIWYGDVLIEERGGKLGIRFTHSPSLAGYLEHWQYDTFVARWHTRALAADAYVTFSLKPNGSIDEVKMTPVSPLTDFSFDFQDLLLKPVGANSAPH